MRKLSLLLSVLISLVSLVSLSHASSGDITIGNKTYTQEQAQKQIVEPLLQRIQKQKIAKIQARIVSISIKQYTNKQQSAKKQGNTDLANFYSGVVNTLKGKINISSTGSIDRLGGSTSIIQRGYTGNKENNLLNSTTKNSTKQSPGLNSGAGIGGNGTNDYNGMTQTQKEHAMMEQQVNEDYTVYIQMKLKQSDFLKEIASKHGTSSYAYQYAQTLSFGSLGSVNNNNAGGTTTNQTGLSGTVQEQSIIKGQVNTVYNNVKNTATKTQFLQAIAEDYGGKGSYAYQFAQTLSFSK